MSRIRIPTPLLAAAVAALALLDAVVMTPVADAVDEEVVELELINLPMNAFMMGGMAVSEADLNGVRVKVERDGDDLFVVYTNPGDQQVEIDVQSVSWHVTVRDPGLAGFTLDELRAFRDELRRRQSVEGVPGESKLVYGDDAHSE